MPTLDVERHLQEQMSAPDPWGLDANPFEARRYACMAELLAPSAPFGDALEVGCAAGAFSERLARLSRRLHLVDRVPAALDRAAARIGAVTNVTWEVADIGRAPIVERAFDAIVVAEVLYFLPDAAALDYAVATLAARLAPNGVLILGSALDEVVARWGLAGGAETTMRALDRYLRRDALTHVTGADAGENTYIALYRHRTPELRS